MHTHFLNKNLYRKYPFKGDADLCPTGGSALPLNLFSAAQFTSKLGYLNIYVSRLYVKDNYVNVFIASKSDTGVVTYLGYFDAYITADYQTVQLTPLVSFATGSLTFGLLEAVKSLNGYYRFEYTSSQIESSLVTCIPFPAVTSFIHEGIPVTGNIQFEFTNLSYELEGTDTVSLSVIDRSSVTAINDKNSKLGNCPTTTIGSINGVPPDEAGNIDIYGIYPVAISVTREGLYLTLPNWSMKDICDSSGPIPPLVTQSKYLNDITRAEKAEWQSWPAYTKP